MAKVVIQEMIPSTWRKAIYAGYAIIGVIIGAIQVGFAAAELGQPVWLTVTLAVYAFVGGAVGLTASTHTPQQKHVEPSIDHGPDSYDLRA
jgi:hypothetical protein